METITVKRVSAHPYQELRLIQHSVAAWAISKDWMARGRPPRDPANLLMLIVTELAECCEAFRNGNPQCERPGMEQFTHAEEELADAVIRILQMAAEFDFDLAGAIEAKMEFNWTRPAKHGKEF